MNSKIVVTRHCSELISSYHEKLSEVLSPIVAETFRITLVDKLMTTLSPLRNFDEPRVFDKVSHLLADWGIKMRIDEKGEQLHCTVDCPYAPVVHPLISSAHPQCPLGYMVLGAARISELGVEMQGNRLTANGAELTMKRKKERQ